MLVPVRSYIWCIMFDLIAVLVVFTALASYLNFRFLRLPFAIGVMSLTIASSFLIMIAGRFYPDIQQHAARFVRQLDFNNAVLHGMLGFLLFAGALHIKLEELARWRLTIVLLATVGVLLSTAIVASVVWLALSALGIETRFIDCLLFGADFSHRSGGGVGCAEAHAHSQADRNYHRR